MASFIERQRRLATTWQNTIFSQKRVTSHCKSDLGECQGLERLKAAAQRFGAESKKVQAGWPLAHRPLHQINKHLVAKHMVWVYLKHIKTREHANISKHIRTYQNISNHVKHTHTHVYGYGSIPINTIFRGMNIHLAAILM